MFVFWYPVGLQKAHGEFPSFPEFSLVQCLMSHWHQEVNWIRSQLSLSDHFLDTVPDWHLDLMRSSGKWSPRNYAWIREIYHVATVTNLHSTLSTKTLRFTLAKSAGMNVLHLSCPVWQSGALFGLWALSKILPNLCFVTCRLAS